MKNSVLLINARTGAGAPAYIPSGLCSVGAVLRGGGIECEILDRSVDFTDMREVARQRDVAIYGISVLTGPVILDAIEVSRAIKTNNPDAIVVWGGLHPTICPDSVLNEGYVDYIVRGEGEYPMLELCEHLFHKRGELSQIQNLGYRVDGRQVLNPVRPWIDLEKLPLPAWNMLTMENYFLTKHYAYRAVNLNTSRGCPHRCSFCYNEAVNKRKWRGVSAGRIIEMIEYMQKRHGVDGVFFHEDNFDVSRKRLVEFCNLLLEKRIDIKWEHFSRVGYVTEERLALEKKAGCAVIAYGIESGSDKLLDEMAKDQTVEDVLRAAKIWQKVGMRVAVGIMIGYPDQTVEEVDKSLALVETIKPFLAFPSMYNPYPGTPLFDQVIQRGLFQFPTRLEDQGKIYDLWNFDLNTSRIPKAYLVQIYNRYTFRNSINEFLGYFRYRNFAGLFRVFRYKINLKLIRSFLSGLLADIFLSKRADRQSSRPRPT